MNKTQVVCPSCSKTVELFRDKKGRIIIPALLGVGFAIVGAVIGTTIGFVTYGTLVADKFLDKFVCKECRKRIKI